MGVVAHIHYLHLTDFVNSEAVVAVVEDGWHFEYAIERCDELLFASHKANQPLRVVEYGPSVLKGVSFREISTPFVWIERKGEVSVGFASAHKPGFFQVESPIVPSSFLKRLQLLFLLSQGLSQLVYTPVVVGVFEGSRRAFVNAYVARHIAQLVVFLPAQATCRRDFGMNGIGIAYHRFPQGFYVIAAKTFYVGVGHYRCGIVAYHTAPVSRTCPFRKETAFEIGVYESFLNLYVSVGVD